MAEDVELLQWLAIEAEARPEQDPTDPTDPTAEWGDWTE